jgi:hypothetical protein
MEPQILKIYIYILLYADNTSIIVTSPNLENFKTQIDKIWGDINWFKINKLVLNYDKTLYPQFNTKNSRDYDLKLNYQGNYVKSSTNTKFLYINIYTNKHATSQTHTYSAFSYNLPKCKVLQP